eukprot:Blabericola_migrator_1__3373@NODE_1999_length_3441_cov_162_817427_g1138_i1_p1_GENE_NODE_1999_length_3441_cov_162_817427_g1138_i1NODE_1999_length_3441_cov_162_817427_g1138_i1_p1_ORF_typecomplete_len402_score55_21_NODE_1999_length_3441_cov_162_817427_g1138_i115812786
MLDDGPLIEQGNGINQNPALEDGEISPLAQSGEHVDSKQSRLAHIETAAESEPPVIGLISRSPSDHVFRFLETSGIRDDFRKAALRPLSTSQSQSEGEDHRTKSVELDIPSFLNPTYQVDDPRFEAIKEVAELRRANQLEQASAAMRNHFSEGEFEKHFFSSLRQHMFYWTKQKPSIGDEALPGSLIYRYALEMQCWCASVFDATVRRVKFAIDPVKSCLSEEDPITGEMKCHSEGDLPNDLAKDIVKTRGWLEDFLQAEPKFRTAVNKFKNKMKTDFHKEWIAYKEKHMLTSSTTKTRRLKEPLCSVTYLTKNTHFISWYLRRITPACFLYRHKQIANAIRAIEGDTSMLANVLDNLCVQDVEAFEKTRRMLEEERFHSYVKVPQEFDPEPPLDHHTVPQ